MVYRGFEIKFTARRIHGFDQRGTGIFRDGECLTIAANVTLAKAHIDDRIKSGVWKERQEGKNE